MASPWRRDMWTDIPPLGVAARQARAALAGGEAFHLAVVTDFCNRQHYGRPPHSCAECYLREACGGEVDAALIYAASLRRRPPAEE